MIARLILLLVFSLSWLPAPSAWAAAAAPQLPRVRIAYSSISSIFAGLWVAKEAGVFEKYGLRGELLYIGAGSVAVQAMMGGEVEVVAGAGNAVVSAILQGAPLVSVGSVANRPWRSCSPPLRRRRVCFPMPRAWTTTAHSFRASGLVSSIFAIQPE